MNHENQNIEYKHQWQDDVLKSICAFANSAGGELTNTTVLFGKQPSKFFSGIEEIRNAVQAKGMSAPTISTEMGGVSVRFFRAGLSSSSEKNTDILQAQPYNLNLTTLQVQIEEFCKEWRTMGEIAKHVQRSRQYIRGKILPKMSDRLQRIYDNPNHPKQQYKLKS